MASLNEAQIRAQAIKLFEEKYSYTVIAQKLGRSKAWISKWVSRYKSIPFESLQDRRSARPNRSTKSSLTTAAKKLIQKSKYQRGQSIRKLEYRLKGRGINVSRETIRQFMRKKLKWKSFKRQKVPRLTDEYKKRRINFAKQYKNCDWSTVMFTDESPFKLFHIPNSKNDVVWGSQECSVPRAPQVKFSPSVLVWGGITVRGLTKLHIIPEKTSVDSNYYISEILEKVVKPAFLRSSTSTDLTATKLFQDNRKGVLQQDGARAHTSKATIHWLESNNYNYISPKDWPPNSPDLSPIENIWSIMAAKVYADPEPKTMSGLKRRLQKAWKAIPLETLQNLFCSMPKRLLNVISNK